MHVMAREREFELVLRDEGQEKKKKKKKKNELQR